MESDVFFCDGVNIIFPRCQIGFQVILKRIEAIPCFLRYPLIE